MTYKMRHPVFMMLAHNEIAALFDGVNISYKITIERGRLVVTIIPDNEYNRSGFIEIDPEIIDQYDPDDVFWKYGDLIADDPEPEAGSS